MEHMNKFVVKPKMTYYATHIPTKENWIILGINKDRGEVCVAGWPPTIAKLSDLIDIEERFERTKGEEEHVRNKFGVSFLN